MSRRVRFQNIPTSDAGSGSWPPRKLKPFTALKGAESKSHLIHLEHWQDGTVRGIVHLRQHSQGHVSSDGACNNKVRLSMCDAGLTCSAQRNGMSIRLAACQ